VPEALLASSIVLILVVPGFFCEGEDGRSSSGDKLRTGSCSPKTTRERGLVRTDAEGGVFQGRRKEEACLQELRGAQRAWWSAASMDALEYALAWAGEIKRAGERKAKEEKVKEEEEERRSELLRLEPNFFSVTGIVIPLSPLRFTRKDAATLSMLA
jgi:hypothetical protein